MFGFLVPIIIIILGIYLAKNKHAPNVRNLLGESFIFLSILFFWYTLFAINRNFGSPLSWSPILISVSLVSILISYLHKSSLTLLFGLITFYIGWNSWVIGNQWGIETGRIISFIAMQIYLALLYFSLGSLNLNHLKYKNFYQIYTTFGMFIVFIILFSVSTKSGLSLLGSLTQTGKLFASLKLSFSTIGLGIAALVITAIAHLRNKLNSWELSGVVLVGLVFTLLALSGPQQWFVKNMLTSSGMLWLFVFNIILFAISVGYILMGLVKNEEWPINLGVVLVSLFIIVKYFDWLFTFLDKSIFFIGAGLLMLGLGLFLERGRKNLLARLKKHES